MIRNNQITKHHEFRYYIPRKLDPDASRAQQSQITNGKALAADADADADADAKPLSSSRQAFSHFFGGGG